MKKDVTIAKKDVTIGRKILSLSIKAELFYDFIEICRKQHLNRSAIISTYIDRFVKNELKSVNKKVAGKERK